MFNFKESDKKINESLSNEPAQFLGWTSLMNFVKWSEILNVYMLRKMLFYMLILPQ